MLQARDRWLEGTSEIACNPQEDRGAHVKGEWWSEGQVKSLRDQLPYESVRTLLDLCSERPGNWIDKAEADASAGVTPRQSASELSALSKFTLRQFGPGRDGKPKWPIESRKVANKFSYRMSPEIADLWRA
jgi:hypothetical protein